MSSFRRPWREELAAALVAGLLISSGVRWWLRRDGEGDRCCAPTTARALDAAIPADSEVYARTLSNGMHYYIRANAGPKQRAELRLVVNAGSVLERPDERGLAHAVEHMAFRGTKHFPAHAVDDYLQSIGMRAGEDVNASTSQDETIYRITVPTDRAGVLDTALAILADMAHAATFDPKEARQEAGVVFEEWRSRHGARDRLSEERNALLLAGSRYADRATIGDTAVLRRFDVSTMRRFYDDWYRPELMAVVVVGDFDTAPVERLVKKYFGAIPSSETPRARPPISVPRAHAPRAATLTDAEATGARVSVWFPRASTPRRRVSDYRTELVAELWRDVLNARLEDAADQPGSPLLSGAVSRQHVARPLEAEVVSASVMEANSVAALDVLLGEVGRLARTGPTPRELKQRAAALLRDRRQAEEWQDASDDIADAFVDEFLTGELAVNRETAYELARDLLPTITAADLGGLARRVSIDSGALVLLTGPSARALAGVTPAELIARARVATSRAADRPLEASDSVTLVPHPPAPGKIASERSVSDARVFDWTLANGMRVILKPTRFSYDQIEFRMVGSGGASLASDADFPSAYLSDGVLGSTGVGPLNGTRLSRALDASSLALTPAVTDDAIFLTGSAAPRDLAMLFQLLHLYFTSPRADTVAFRRYRERAVSLSASRGSDPDAIFDDSVAAVAAQRHPRAIRSGARFVNAVTLSKALGFWNARTSNAASFTLVMTGDFTLDRVRPLVARYLASLPAGVREQPRDDRMRFPAGIVRRDIRAGVGPKAKTQIMLSGPLDYTSESSEALAAARDVAELALGAQLRERLGGTYGVNVTAEVSLVPPTRYRVSIEFESSPERIDSLASAALSELERLRSRGPTKLELEKIRAAETRDLDGKVESNRYWATELSTHARMGWPLASITTHQQNAEHMTIKTLRDACAKYLGTTEYARVTMYPKAGAHR